MCPYLGVDSVGYGYCELSARKITFGKVNGLCETDAYLSDCPLISSDRETVGRSSDCESLRAGYSRYDDSDDDKESIYEEEIEEEYVCDDA